MKPARETELYAPIKAFLEGQGYEVKGEVGAADIVARRAEEPPVIVELKLGFSLQLFHQAIARQSLSDTVYVAVPRTKGRRFQKSLKENTKLCRRLGLGLISVRIDRDNFVEVHLDPKPYQPRKSKQKQARMLREFARRVGDPNTGGTSRKKIMTAYRQDAIRCARFVMKEGPSKGAVVSKAAGVPNATKIMRDDHYGWFERVEVGIYALTPKGVQELADYDKIDI